MMKSSEGGVGGLAREEVDGEVEGSPPGVHRRRPAPVGRAEVGEHERGAGRRGEVGATCAGRMSRARVLVERLAPGNLLRRQDRSRTARRARATAASSSRVTSPTGRSGVAERARRGHRCARRRPRARAGRARHERAGAVGGGQRQRLPAARGQPQRGVLELRLGRGERDGELAENLRVGVERVAGRLTALGEHRPSPAQIAWRSLEQFFDSAHGGLAEHDLEDTPRGRPRPQQRRRRCLRAARQGIRARRPARAACRGG